MLIKINSDTLFITDRLKEIDENYYVVFNTIKNKYELHNSAQIGCTYCLTNINQGLDERLIDLARKTKRENLKTLIDEIDKHNEKLNKQQTNKILQQIGENL